MIRIQNSESRIQKDLGSSNAADHPAAAFFWILDSRF
jgi:hypothetical protein